jgi:histone H3/H4
VPRRYPSEEGQPEESLELPDLDYDLELGKQSEEEELEDSSDKKLQPQSSPKGPYGDVSMQDETQLDSEIVNEQQRKVSRKKRVKVSKYGIQYPSLPAGVVKKLATTFARTAGNSKAKVNKDSLEAIMQASDWFFEQVSDDLGAYARHAGRKTIDESDIVTLMARQRQTNATTTPFSLAQRHLPRELLQELRMVPPAKFQKGRHLERVVEEED